MAVRTTIRTIVAGCALSAVALLAACQQDGMGAGLLPSQNYSLHLVDEGERAKLAYGQANSDNVGLMLECAKGSRHVEISDLARGSDRNLMLRSGELRSDFGGEIMPGPGAAILTASGSADMPALRGFRETGKIEVASGGRSYGVTATPVEHADVKRFFAMCERV